MIKSIENEPRTPGQDNEMQRLIVLLFLPIAFLFFGVFVPVSFFILHDYIAGWIHLATLLVLFSAVIVYFRTKNTRITTNMLASLGVPVLIPWLITGGPSNAGYWWSLVYVVWAFFVTDRKSAFFWLGLHLVLSVIVVVLSGTGVLEIAYSSAELLNILFAYVVTLSLVILFERARNYYTLLSARELEERKKAELALKISNEQLVQEIEDRKRIEQELVKAKMAAENSNMLKDAFLANMSHEIRTPMNAILGFADILHRRDLGRQENEFIEIIKVAGNNLLVIINDILDISKIDADLMVFEESQLSIPDIFHSLKIMLKQRADEKHLRLTFSYAPNIPEMLLGDPVRLTQIITNLVGNAIKFTQIGSVEVMARLMNETDQTCRIQFLVRDTGIGIPADKLDHVFDRFRQAELHTARQHGGAGLGLRLARKLVELQGGKIAVESEENKGSTFSFILTLKKAPETEKSSDAQQPRFDLESLRKLKILLAEDNVINVKLIKHIFAGHGLNVDVAENGRIAVEKLKAGHYDIVLMDIEMPEMNGYDATLEIRNELKNDIPIIALTANAMAGEHEKCLSLGMNGYVSKPIDVDLLFEKMYQLTLQSGSTNGAALISD